MAKGTTCFEFLHGARICGGILELVILVRLPGDPSPDQGHLDKASIGLVLELQHICRKTKIVRPFFFPENNLNFR